MRHHIAGKALLLSFTAAQHHIVHLSILQVAEGGRAAVFPSEKVLVNTGRGKNSVALFLLAGQRVRDLLRRRARPAVRLHAAQTAWQ